MKQEKNIQFDVDKAWDTLYARLEKEQLLPAETENSSNRKRMILLQRVAAVAAICFGVIFSIFYFSQAKNNQLLACQNTEDSGTLVVTLEDGSTVYLASGASIVYPLAFAANQRKVELKGNALFSVTKDKNRPFIIETDRITVEVVGTIFAVQSSPESSFELSVKEGMVNVYSKNNQNCISVEAGEAIQSNESGLYKCEISNFDIFSSFTNKMCFKDEKLDNIVHAINAMYGSPIIISEKSLNNRILTVTFENNSVETMTKLICLALDLEQTSKQDTVFIRK